jgi:hypothetical protein
MCRLPCGQVRPSHARHLGMAIEQGHHQIPLGGELSLIQSVGALLDDNVPALAEPALRAEQRSCPAPTLPAYLPTDYRKIATTTSSSASRTTPRPPSTPPATMAFKLAWTSAGSRFSVHVIRYRVLQSTFEESQPMLRCRFGIARIWRSRQPLTRL